MYTRHYNNLTPRVQVVLNK